MDRRGGLHDGGEFGIGERERHWAEILSRQLRVQPSGFHDSREALKLVR